MPIPALKILTAAALLCLTARAQEGRLLLQLVSPGSGGTVASGGFGRSVSTIGDIDGDGTADIAVGHPSSFGATTTGRIQLVSGQTGQPIRVCSSTQNGYVGHEVSPIGDVDGDLVPDVLGLGGSFAGPTGGSVTVFSGSNGSVALHLGVFATAIAAPGDWNGDQVPDVAYVASGILTVASGVGGAPIATPGSAGAVASIAGSQPGTHWLAALSGNTVSLHSSTGATLWTAAGYTQVAAAGDYNGDQLGDVLAASGSTVDVLSGLDGTLLHTGSYAAFDTLAGGVDLDADQVVDLVTGSSSGRGFVRAYSGATGALVFEREGQELGESFGAAVAMHPGAGSSPRAAVLVGAPNRFNGSVEYGMLQVIANAQPGEFDGSFRPFGARCNFTFTTIRPGATLPTIGQTYGYRFDNSTSPTGFEYIVHGLSNATWAGIPLPFTVPGSTLSCQLLISADALVPTNSSSFASFSIPLNSAFVGVSVFVQGFNIFGYPVVESSDAAELIIGN